MERRLLAVLGLGALVLSACSTYAGPTADCFAFVAIGQAAHSCDFRPVAGAEGFRP